MILLALDLGTTTGYAIGSPGAVISGVWSHKGGRFDGGGMRFLRFRENLNRLLSAYKVIDEVVFEEVRRHVGTDAAHVYGGMMATLTAWCEEGRVPYAGVPVGTIKRFATGKGNADKPAMIAAVQAWGYEATDDNHADALALFHYWLSTKAAKA